MDYSDKLRDPRWQKLKSEVLTRDDFACQHCGNRAEELHVHHRYYEAGREPWEYPHEALITLCRTHHEKVTVATRKLRISVGMFPVPVEDVLRECLDSIAYSSEHDLAELRTRLAGWLEVVKHADLLQRALDRKAGRE